MKVLFLSVTPGLFVEGKIGGWIASLENIIHLQLHEVIELGLVFETQDDQLSKVNKNGTIYYPIYVHTSFVQRVSSYSDIAKRWNYIKPYFKSAIDDFKPDIIHCFGSEWPYAAIVKCVDVPLVVHMQGFLNIYNLSKNMVMNIFDEYHARLFKPKQLLKVLISTKKEKSNNDFERELMKDNHYFMGRTQWDKNIVKYYSPGAKYYHVPEAIRPDIFNTCKFWSYHRTDKIRLITITQAGYLKGNEIILRTAQILKDLIGVNFEWRVAGSKAAFSLFEKKAHIQAFAVNITLLGMIGTDQIVDELANADFYIHPAIIDNSPNSLCEAQLVGCPVIAANVGGISQFVDEGKTGFLYPYNEPHTLAFKICNIIDKKDLLTKVSEAEIEISHKRHDPANIASVVYNTYNAIINDYIERYKNV